MVDYQPSQVESLTLKVFGFGIEGVLDQLELNAG